MRPAFCTREKRGRDTVACWLEDATFVGIYRKCQHALSTIKDLQSHVSPGVNDTSVSSSRVSSAWSANSPVANFPRFGLVNSSILNSLQRSAEVEPIVSRGAGGLWQTFSGSRRRFLLELFVLCSTGTVSIKTHTFNHWLIWMHINTCAIRAGAATPSWNWQWPRLFKWSCKGVLPGVIQALICRDQPNSLLAQGCTWLCWIRISLSYEFQCEHSEAFQCLASGTGVFFFFRRRSKARGLKEWQNKQRLDVAKQKVLGDWGTYPLIHQRWILRAYKLQTTQAKRHFQQSTKPPLTPTPKIIHIMA